MKLPKTLTNELIETIRSAGLDPAVFNYSSSSSEYRTDHRSSGSYFALDLTRTSFPISYLIAGEVLEVKLDAYIWSGVIDHLKRWATRVKQDIETPDLWAELQGETRLFGAGPFQDIENTPFTPEEKQELTQLLQQGGNYVEQTYPLSEEEIREWRAQLAYLTEAVDHLGRRDWRGVLIATLVEFAFYLAPDPAGVRDILYTFLKATGHFFGTHLGELPIQ